MTELSSGMRSNSKEKEFPEHRASLAKLPLQALFWQAFCKGQKLEAFARHRGITSWEGDRCAELCVCMHTHACLHTHQLQSVGGLLKRKERTEGAGQRVALKRFESRSLLTRFFSQALWTLA